MSFYPIEDITGLEQRRAGVGLPPLAVYISMLESLYHVTVLPPD